MQTIESVKQQIELNQELLAETKKRITDTSTRLAKAQESSERAKANIKTTKEKRQLGLAKGENINSLSADIVKLEKDSELLTEEIAGLQSFLAELQEEERTLHLKAGELPKRILQLRSIELAAQYNSLAEEMAPVVEELNKIYYKLTGNGNNKETAVVFYPMEGCFEKLPKIFYDDAGLNLEQFVAKNPGKYHSNNHLSAEEKSFYDWPSHQNKLRNG